MSTEIGFTIDQMQVGMTRSYAKTLTETDIVLFAAASGDINSVHLNQEYAEKTPFGGRIAHGILTAGVVSACIANKLPGVGTVYLGQTLKFKAPVRPGDTVTATVTVKSLDADKNRVVLDTICQVAGKTVLEGEATVLAPK
ncbi:MAG: MaoC family dehydratase [Rhodocyclaceae bacterium]|jgi:3-hydroxybutyryl-CoA dehydratase|nr:MaoC family dehydratase [Rhodocyclaceae bacterium]